eukprot:7700614-Pyramimonas_sp.AAC.1
MGSNSRPFLRFSATMRDPASPKLMAMSLCSLLNVSSKKCISYGWLLTGASLASLTLRLKRPLIERPTFTPFDNTLITCETDREEDQSDAGRAGIFA